jgi:pectin methylesterase-like acyl-CoA thioesterase
MFRNKFAVVFVFGLLILVFQSCKLFSGPDYDILARSTDFEDVQAAVDSAESGDIIRVPRGSSTWTFRLEIPDDKKITLLGSGQEATVISSGTSEPSSLINMGSSGSRVTNMGFKLSNDNGNGITVRGEGWRIDHCQFDNNI